MAGKRNEKDLFFFDGGFLGESDELQHFGGESGEPDGLRFDVLKCPYLARSGKRDTLQQLRIPLNPGQRCFQLMGECGEKQPLFFICGGK